MMDTLNMTHQRRAFVSRQDLELMLNRHFGRERRIVDFQCRPSPYASSHRLLELNVTLDDGTALDMLSKHVGVDGLMEAARQAKPTLLHHPTREVEMYQSVLDGLGDLIPTCYGVLVNHQQEPSWLVLERIDGLELRRFGDFTHWTQAVHSLAGLHSQTASRVTRLSEEDTPSLLEYDAEYYWTWPMRVVENAARARVPWPRDAEIRIIQLARGYGTVVDYLTSLPIAVIHGDCFPSNVLLKPGASQNALHFVDWEMAAIGPRLMDVAALTAGAWTETAQRELVRAYRHALEASKNPVPSFDEMLRAVDFCRLHLAMQLLGWSPEWTPPSEQAQDWLGEALRLAEKLDL